MWGSGGSARGLSVLDPEGRSSETGVDVVLVAGDELGEEIEAVERSDAASVRRICDSVLRTSFVTQAVGRVSFNSTAE
jgi:hypothetical protein